MRLTDLLPTELNWNQPSGWKSYYELFHAQERIATLQFEGFLQNRARLDSTDGCWNLAHHGFWQSRVDVSPCGSDQVIAFYERSLWKGGGTLVLPYDQRLSLRFNGWKAEMRLTPYESDDVLILYSRASFWKTIGRVEIDNQLRARIPSYPLAVLLGWYAHVQSVRDQMAAAASA